MACDEGGVTACVSPDGDGDHCGGCANKCGAGELCADGACHNVAPATPCTACPCDTCDAMVKGMMAGGNSVACCPSPNGPLCVIGDKCPP